MQLKLLPRSTRSIDWKGRDTTSSDQLGRGLFTLQRWKLQRLWSHHFLPPFCCQQCWRAAQRHRSWACRRFWNQCQECYNLYAANWCGWIWPRGTRYWGWWQTVYYTKATVWQIVSAKGVPPPPFTDFFCKFCFAEFRGPPHLPIAPTKAKNSVLHQIKGRN